MVVVNGKLPRRAIGNIPREIRDTILSRHNSREENVETLRLTSNDPRRQMRTRRKLKKPRKKYVKGNQTKNSNSLNSNPSTDPVPTSSPNPRTKKRDNGGSEATTVITIKATNPWSGGATKKEHVSSPRNTTPQPYSDAENDHNDGQDAMDTMDEDGTDRDYSVTYSLSSKDPHDRFDPSHEPISPSISANDPIPHVSLHYLKKQRRCTYFNAQIDFAHFLEGVSAALESAQRPQRQDLLVANMDYANSTLPQGLYLPIAASATTKHKSIKAVCAKECRCLDSAEKVPFMMFCEVVNHDYPTSSQNIIDE
ncbi:hypothetical protein RFI_18199, partial [Reticulomyxa filosa]